MQFNMERWYSAASQRFSVRRYKGGAEAQDIMSLRETAEGLCTRGVRIEIGESERAFTGVKAAKLSGTPCFAAFIANRDTKPESLGYLGEAFILECTALGLGTCWAGMSFNRAAVEKAITLNKHERVVCVTPIGIPGEGYSARPRKTLNKLTGLTDEQLVEIPEWQQHAIECARKAPSAVNGQPWSFTLRENGVTVERTSSNFGYGTLDCGIAMLHIELGASHGGMTGEWQDVKGGWAFTVQQG